jgi:hypothetical protein
LDPEFRSEQHHHGGVRAFTPTLSYDNSNTGNTGGNFGEDRPNVLHSPALANPSPQEWWFDVTAFAIPPQYTWGDAGRNILRGPGRRIVFVAKAEIERQIPPYLPIVLNVSAPRL